MLHAYGRVHATASRPTCRPPTDSYESKIRSRRLGPGGKVPRVLRARRRKGGKRVWLLAGPIIGVRNPEIRGGPPGTTCRNGSRNYLDARARPAKRGSRARYICIYIHDASPRAPGLQFKNVGVRLSTKSRNAERRGGGGYRRNLDAEKP